MTDLGNNDKENQEKSARDMNDESLFDRLFPDELIEMVKGWFSKEDDDGDE